VANAKGTESAKCDLGLISRGCFCIGNACKKTEQRNEVISYDHDAPLLREKLFKILNVRQSNPGILMDLPDIIRIKSVP